MALLFYNMKYIQILKPYEMTAYWMQALVGQLDSRSTGDQAVLRSIPAGTATFFHGDCMIMK